MTLVRASIIGPALLAQLLVAGLASAATDIVLYSSDLSTHGSWTKAADSTAAGGQMVTSVDSGLSTPNAPLASPSNYVEATFTAPASTPYRIWARLRAGGNSKWNDSLWVQFSDSTDSSGAAIYRIGSTSGYLENLEQCSSCPLSGWGWPNGGYWLTQTSTVRFASSGSHTIRVQIREDGVQLDQIVLSPSTYLSSAPGQPINDLTIVAKSASSTPPSTGPYHGAPAAIPGTIQAEDFDNGGEGAGYHDTTAGNSGGAYRQTDVDIEPASSGGYDVGWFAAGEWMNYSVNVASAGTYTVQVRVASPSGGSMHVGFNTASNIWAVVNVPNSGGWQNWTTVSFTATLGAGVQLMTLQSDTGGFNVDSINVSSGGAGGTPPPPTAYPLTVVNGSGSGSYAAGTSVTITASPAPAGQTFAAWTGATVANASSATTVLVMPSAARTVTATYSTTPPPTAYPLTVVNGSGSGSYAAGTSVTITANPAPAGQTFAAWTGATVANASSATTVLVMPSAARTVTATYSTTPPPTAYSLTVVNGSGSGSYAAGTSVTIIANPAPAGQTFAAWTGATVANASSATTVLVMPGAARTVTATYSTTPPPPPPPPNGTTFYVSPTGNDAVSCATAQTATTPKKTLASGFSCLTPGATLVLRNGTYPDAIQNVPNGTAAAYVTIRAENDGGAIVTGGLTLVHTNAYIVMAGMRLQDTRGRVILGNHLKFQHLEFKGGCAVGNCVNVDIGSNNFNDTADILVEDSWVHGAGGRYNLLVYNANRIVIRRVVIRHDGGWSDSQDAGDPEAGLTFYNCSNCAAQNDVVLDSNLTYHQWQSAFYGVQNSASPNSSNNNSWVGIISLNNQSATDGAGLRFDGDQPQTGHVVQDAVLWDAPWGLNVSYAANVSVTGTGMTIGRNSGNGISIGGGSGGTKVFKNVRFFNTTLSGETATNTIVGAPVFLPQQLGGIGANVATMIGTTGTLMGDPGWNVDTGANLWPWPNEARLKKEMCTDAGITRGFCAAVSLTNYIWGYLGNASPF